MTVSSKSQAVRALAVLAAAGAAGVALSACTPNEPTTDDRGTTPAVQSGNPAPTSGIEEADGIPPAGSGHGDTDGGLTHPEGDHGMGELVKAGGQTVGEFVVAPSGDTLTVTVKINEGSGIPAGVHPLSVHTGATCEGDFASAGAAVSGISLVPVNILADGSGSTTTTVAGDLDAVTGKTLLVAGDGDTRLACGTIDAS
ncbi:MAG: superoxide dismutase family protein [Gordonia sp. (in: high G+C Gram-positive bacteria)]